MKIKHIAIRVRDLEKSIKFYETVTELKIGKRISAPPAELAFMTNGHGDTEVELVHIPESQCFEGKGLFICFETDKLFEMHKKVTDCGYNPSAIQNPGDGTKYFYVYDPDGVSVQLRSFN